MTTVPTIDDAQRERTVPPGRLLALPGGRTTFVRELAGPPGAPTVVLLHGLGATGALNWFSSFDALGERFHVVCPDQRGHGRGIRSLRPFSLEACADDAVALADALSTGPVIAVGYSLGGPVAQLIAEAAAALGRFDSRPWIGDVDVPAAVVLTTRDRLVPAALQADLARASRATVHLVDGGHDVAAAAPEQFVPMLVEACDTVARRAFRGDAS
jgi:pimeloyl-ACP methyl ester carboxylesterase